MYLDCWILSSFWIPLGKGRVVGGSVGVALVLTQRHGASEVGSSCSSSQCRLSMAACVPLLRPHGMDGFLEGGVLDSVMEKHLFVSNAIRNLSCRASDSH